MTTEIAERLYTLDDYLALPDDGKKYELVDGRLIEMAGPSYDHGEIIENVRRPLANFVWQHTLGSIVNDVAFSYDPARPNSARVPDLAFIALTRLGGFNRSKAVPFAPDLAVEVVSPTDYMFEVEEKVQEYRRFGVKLIWVIISLSQTVHIYRADNPRMRGVSIDDELHGEDVIPGFSIAVRDIFHVLAPSPQDEQGQV